MRQSESTTGSTYRGLEGNLAPPVMPSGGQSLRLRGLDESWLVSLSGPMLTAVVGVALFLGALTVTWVSDTSTAAGFWPPSGIAFVAFLIIPPRRWGWLVAAIVAVDLVAVAFGAFDLRTGLVWAVANSVEPMIGAVAMRRMRGRADVPLPKLVAVCISFAVVLGPAVGGAIGALGSSFAFDVAWWQEWLEWTVGDGLGVMLVAPLLLADSSTRRHRLIEWFGLAVVVAGVSALTFSDVGPGDGATIPYLIFVVLVACAMYFGLRTVAAVAFVIAEVATWRRSTTVARSVRRPPGSAPLCRCRCFSRSRSAPA